MLSLFGKYKSWMAIPKFLNMRKYTEDIRRYGMTALTTTGPKESFNKTLRAAWQFTNKKSSTMQEKVCQCLLLKLLEIKVIDPLNIIQFTTNLTTNSLNTAHH